MFEKVTRATVVGQQRLYFAAKGLVGSTGRLQQRRALVRLPLER
jgi:hypothetical protein